MSRKIIQISTVAPGDGGGNFVIFALASDGTIWKKIETRGDVATKPWAEVDGIPDAMSDDDFDEMINNPINR